MRIVVECIDSILDPPSYPDDNCWIRHQRLCKRTRRDRLLVPEYHAELTVDGSDRWTISLGG